MYDLIIIGSGSSGLYAGYLAKLHKLNTLILEASTDHGGQMKLFLDKPVYDMPGQFDINGKIIMKKLYEQLKSVDLKAIKYNEKVISIEGQVNNFTVSTQKSKYNSRSIIFATGGGFFKNTHLGIKNEENYKNIIYSIKNSKEYFNKKIVIFGGGDTAIDWAHYFYEKKSNVTLVHRRDKFRGQDYLLEKIKNQINIITPYKIFEVEGENNVNKVIIQNVKTKEFKKIDCDYIFVFFGQQKILSKETNFDIKKDIRGYFVKSNMETSRNGIFAIGNIANYHGKIKMMITGLGEAATAVGAIVELLRPGKKMSYYVKKKEN